MPSEGLLFTPLESGMAAQVETEPGTNSASSTFPLLQVGLGGPDGGVVGHVVVRCEEFHFLPISTTQEQLFSLMFELKQKL